MFSLNGQLFLPSKPSKTKKSKLIKLVEVPKLIDEIIIESVQTITGNYTGARLKSGH